MFQAAAYSKKQNDSVKIKLNSFLQNNDSVTIGDTLSNPALTINRGDLVGQF